MNSIALVEVPPICVANGDAKEMAKGGHRRISANGQVHDSYSNGRTCDGGRLRVKVADRRDDVSYFHSTIENAPAPAAEPRVSRGSGPTTLGLLGLSAFQVARGPTFGPVTENFWNAYGAMRILNNPTIALIFAGLGSFN